ncbi:MAG TPA: hypothetical protein VER79_01620 [Candidatus Limnocylindrales bacterium]|nr:hypothetical protein [Candidatus Limnocylindrales bacterium]
MIRNIAPRLVLGVLLLIGLELLPWAAPDARCTLEWPLLAVGYTALAALLLDMAARLRMRDGYGVLALAGLAGAGAALLFNPAYALANPPLTWFTRALGACALGGMLALLLFLQGTRPMNRPAAALLLMLSAAGGALWGYWARWSPQAVDATAPPTPPEVIVLTAVLVLLVLIAVLALSGRARTGEPLDLRLPPPVLAVLLLALLAVFLGRVLSESVDAASALALSLAGAMSLAVLYYQKRPRGLTLLDGIERLPPANWPKLVVPAAVLVVAGAVLGAGLPRGPLDSDAVAILAAGITAFGFLWLPGVALVIGARAFGRLARTDRL